MRLLHAGAIAGLHSLGKGANRTPPDRAAAVIPSVGCGGSACRRRGPCAVRNGAFCGFQRGRTDRQDGKGLANVTTMPSAEHTRRDFLYIMTGAVAAAGAAAAAV